MAGGEKKNGRNKALRILNIALIVLVAALVVFLVVKVFFVTRITVTQTSMSPTYADGESVFVNRLGSIERGKVVVYFDDDVAVPRLASAFGLFAGEAKLLIKRVVALENDMIWLERVEGGYEVVIRFSDGEDGTTKEEYTDRNGEKVALDPITLNPDIAGVLRNATRWDPYIVGEGCAFMMGDNRTVSQDSRVMGDVPLSRVIGTVD